MDHTGGYYMAMAIMLALLHRQRTGEGQWVDLACTEAAVTLNGPALLDWSVNKKPMRGRGAPNSNRSQYAPMAPHGIYPCRGDDHWIAISCRHQADWQHLAATIARDWVELFVDETYRLEHQDELDRLVAEWTRDWDKFELQQVLRALPIPAAAVQKPAERIAQDATTGNFGLWPTVEHSAMGEVQVDGLPVHFSTTDWRMARGAPCLGEHNTHVLTRLLGLSAAEVASLTEEGVL